MWSIVFIFACTAERLEGSQPEDCIDRADNDMDGDFDCDDDGCQNSPDCQDTGTVAQPLEEPSSEDTGAPDSQDTGEEEEQDPQDTSEQEDPETFDFYSDFEKADYQQVLYLGTRFYGAQRCGDHHNWILQDNAFGDHCHLEDGPAYQAGADMVGGWHDAGDFIKFSLTHSWAVYTLLKGYEVFPSAYRDQDQHDYSGVANGVPDVLDEVKQATDYLKKLHPDSQTLIARIGGDQDHDSWVTSPYQSTLSVEQGGGARPVYTGAQADIAGITAAALALMSQLYEPFDAEYSAECLELAVSIYELGKTRPGTTADSFYPDGSWEDSMLCGAAELYRATNNGSYLDDAIGYNDSIGTHWWVVGWDNNTDYCRHSLFLSGETAALDNWHSDVSRYPGAVTSDQYVDGLAWFLNWGSLRFAMNAAFSAALYYDVTGETAYRDFAISQADYVLGSNEYARSFVVGWGENPPQHPHHANAYGREALDWDLSQPFLHSLEGAMVAGPTQSWEEVSSPGYADDINDWVGNEVTIDYNAGFVSTMAFMVHLYGGQ